MKSNPHITMNSLSDTQWKEFQDQFNPITPVMATVEHDRMLMQFGPTTQEQNLVVQVFTFCFPIFKITYYSIQSLPLTIA